jgi:hypothetical protein
MARAIAVALALLALTACSTSRACLKPEAAELEVRHGGPIRFPARSVSIADDVLSMTSGCPEPDTWCARLAGAELQAIRSLVTSGELATEIASRNGGICGVTDTRTFTIEMPGVGELTICHEDAGQSSTVEKLLNIIDGVAHRSFGWRYGHTLADGPTFWQRMRARNYRCSGDR